MDPITHLTQKLQAERARQPFQQQQQAQQQPPPPPYEGFDSDDDDDEEEAVAADTPSSSPLKLTINAANSIQGCNNLVPTSPTAIADATRFSAILLQAVNQINNLAQNGATAQPPKPLKIDLTINCGLTIVGDRNVVGNVGLKPKSPMAIAGIQKVGNNVVAGAKRKTDSVS